MSEHKTWIGKVLSGIGHFFSGGIKKAAAVAVDITEKVKNVLDNSLVNSVAVYVDTAFKTHLAEATVSLIKDSIPKILAAELAIVGLPDKPTEQDLIDFENRVYTAITGLPPLETSKLYTTLAAQIYLIVKEDIDAGKHLTWAELIKDVEEAYDDYKKDVEAQ